MIPLLQPGDDSNTTYTTSRLVKLCDKSPPLVYCLPVFVPCIRWQVKNRAFVGTCPSGAPRCLHYYLPAQPITADGSLLKAQCSGKVYRELLVDK